MATRESTSQAVLNDIQRVGLQQIEEMLERAYALVVASKIYLESTKDEDELVAVSTPIQLLDMAMNELGQRSAFKVVQRGTFEGEVLAPTVLQ